MLKGNYLLHLNGMSGRLISLLLTAFTLGFPGFTLAQEFPTKPIRLVVPFAAGGPTDIVSRAYGQKMSTAIGQAIVIENRGGAAGVIGSDIVAKAAPDGYTMLLASFGFPLNPILFDNVPYDTVRDFTGVSLLAKGPVVVVVNTALPVRTLKEFIAYAKARPGQLNYSSTGPAASGSLALLAFEKATGVKTTMINYKGAGPGTLAVISGEVQFAFPSLAAVTGHIKAGKLRALAVTSAQRSSILPDVPTIAEEAVPGYEETAWYGILVPSKTPAAIVNKLSKETQTVVNSPEIRKTYLSLGLEPAGSTSAELTQHISREFTRWSKELKRLGALPAE